MAKKFIDADLAPIYLNSAACEQIKYMPAADVQEVRHGQWKDANETFECSICGYSFENEGYMHFFYFCPTCGARMDGEKE